MRAIVGRNVRNLRDQAGMTAEDVSKKLRHLGVKWTPSRISELERGLKAVSLAELVALSFALGSKDAPISLSDLFQGNENIEISPTVSTTARHLRDVLSGSPVSQNLSVYPELKPQVQDSMRRLPEKFSEFTNEFIRYGGPNDWELLERIFEEVGLAEGKAAKSLGISQAALLGSAAALWGKSLTREREERAGISAATQDKGHVTRQLMAELRKHLEGINGHN